MTATAQNLGALIVAAIPELRRDVEENGDLHHLNFIDLRVWTEESARSGNTPNVKRAVALVDSIFGDCDSYVSNAVAVSFLEHIDPEDQVGMQIFNELTPALQKEWQAVDEYMIALVGKSVRGQVARRDSRTEK